MHELSVARHLIKVVEQHAISNDAERVVAVHLKIGQHSHIVETALQSSFEQLATESNSVAQGAQLCFERFSMKMYCQSCQQEYAPLEDQFECPNCHQSGKIVDMADEVMIDRMEVLP